tara:strand:+ start:218 stop:424 length:207 start_codon:yes stop_codon:yes gene_type:complete
MTPFKGWGANAAMLDGLDLAVKLHLNNHDNLNVVLEEFETSMLAKVKSKVDKARSAVEQLHPNLDLEA